MKSTASESPEYLFHPKIPRKSQLLFYYLQGEFSLDKKKLDWEPRVKFEALVEIMVKEDLQR
jgi:GDP-D-mannose dehydratase